MREGMPNPQNELIKAEIEAVMSNEKKPNLMEAAGKRAELAHSAEQARKTKIVAEKTKNMPPPIPDVARRKSDADQEQAA
jgi:hypothetical protein